MTEDFQIGDKVYASDYGGAIGVVNAIICSSKHIFIDVKVFGMTYDDHKDIEMFYFYRSEIVKISDEEYFRRMLEL